MGLPLSFVDLLNPEEAIWNMNTMATRVACRARGVGRVLIYECVRVVISMSIASDINAFYILIKIRSKAALFS